MIDKVEIRKAISNAFYESRNRGQTMETAIDVATTAVMALIEVDVEPVVDDKEPPQTFGEQPVAKGATLPRDLAKRIEEIRGEE